MVPWVSKLVVLSNMINRKYPLQHSRKLFCHIQLLIHNMQLIWHKHPSRLNLIIKTSLQIKKEQQLKYRWLTLMCNTKKKVLRPHLQPLFWHHYTLHCLLHLLSYTKQNNYLWLVNNIYVFRLTEDPLMLPSVSNHE